MYWKQIAGLATQCLPYFFPRVRLLPRTIPDFLTSKDNVMDTRYFATSKYEIVKELLRSAGNGNALGIWSSTLGNGMFLCFVKQVWRDEDEEDVVVILRDDELTGVELETHVLYLHEIERVCSFNSSPDRIKRSKEPGVSSKEATLRGNALGDH